MKSMKSIIHSLLQNKENNDDSINNIQSRDSYILNLIYGSLALFFVVVAFWFYRGGNARLLGPPFGSLSGQDFRQILRASDEITKGQNIYQHAIPFANSPDFTEFMRWGASPYPYSPIVAVMAIPLLRFPTETVLIFWTILSWLFLFATAIIVVVGIFESRSIMSALALLIFFSMYGPFHLNLNYVQLDIFILFLVTLTFFLYKKGSLYAGMALGLAISLKLLVVPMVAYFLWKKDWKTGILSVITAAILTIVGFSVAGWDQLASFLRVNYLWSVTDMLSFPLNQSLNGLGIRLFTNNPYIEPLVDAPVLATLLRMTGFIGAILLWVIFVSRKDNRRSPVGFLEYGFTLTSMLFLSPLVDDVHYVWVLLPISGLLMTVATIKFDRKGIVLSILSVLCVLFLAHPDLHDAVYYGWENLVNNNLLVSRKFGLLTGAYVYGLIGLEVLLAIKFLYLRRRIE